MVNRVEVCHDEADGEYTEADENGRFVQWEDVRQVADKAIEALRSCQSNDDTEIAHGDADDALCELISALGLSDVVDEYGKVSKWYA